jgi:hypothetical protein
LGPAPRRRAARQRSLAMLWCLAVVAVIWGNVLGKWLEPLVFAGACHAALD